MQVEVDALEEFDVLLLILMVDDEGLGQQRREVISLVKFEETDERDIDDMGDDEVDDDVVRRELDVIEVETER